MKTDNVIVKKSDIDKKGVFANRNFKTGEIILQWDVKNILTKNKIGRLTDEEKKYITFFDNKYVLMQEPERFVNHSCDANTIVEKFCDIAKRDIKKGKEITTDYRKELPRNFYMKCNCGNKNCAKIIKN